MRLDVVIPANTRAVVRLPGAAIDHVTEGGVPLAQAEGVILPVRVEAATQVEIGSGTYLFEYPLE
jgi:alpha-L-rhamnosidase